MSGREKYELQDTNGDTHYFTSLYERSKFIMENTHLFYHLPLNVLDVPPPTRDMVEQPAHYADRQYEVIDVMRDTMTTEQFIGYVSGCAIKYMMRYDKKDNPIQDLQKCRWYLQKLIDTLEEEQQDVMAR